MTPRQRLINDVIFALRGTHRHCSEIHRNTIDELLDQDKELGRRFDQFVKSFTQFVKDINRQWKQRNA